MADILQAAVVMIGVLLLISDFTALVYKKITESIGLCWFFLGMVLISLGIVPGLCAWVQAVPEEAVPALLLAGAALLSVAFYLSSQVSQLARKNQELAMHVSLLNQENESILEGLKELREHENIIRH